MYKLELKAKNFEKLGASKTGIDEAKESSNLGQSFW